jgi:hypothetical protein
LSLAADPVAETRMSRPAFAIVALLLALALPGGATIAPGLAQGVRIEIPPGPFQVAPRPPRRRVPGYYIERPTPRALVPRRQLNRDEATAALRSSGFTDIAFQRQRGATYIFEATGPRGERVRLIVNSHTGGIDGVRQLGVGRKR